MMPQQYCLRWKHHHSNVQNMFSQLLEKERFCDVTLYCSPSFGAQLPENGGAMELRGVSLRAHRVVLAACSELLASLLGAHETQGEPVLVIDGAEPKHVRQLLDYMYTGEMNVHHSQLTSLLKTAEDLRIKGLSDIRWNNKDEPPDCRTGAVTTTTSTNHSEKPHLKREHEDLHKNGEKFNVNGGPPPLIKLPPKERTSPHRKREGVCDGDMQSPKRLRVASGTDHTDDEDRDLEWQHGSMNITAERVVQWGATEPEGSVGSEEVSDDDWADAPADIGSFLHTKLRVDGDVSGDEESEDENGAMSSGAATGAASQNDMRMDAGKSSAALPKLVPKPLGSSKTGATYSRFSDVIKLNEYLLHGKRPQFWEEDYVKRVMEAVRLKELEMKQAAEILGVSYGTLYGRYRDVYGCINRPYRNARDFWTAKGPSEVLERLQRNEITLEVAAQALGVSTSNLASYVADLTLPPATPHEDITVALNLPHDDNSDLSYAGCLKEVRQYGKMNNDFEPIPIEVDPSLRKKTYSTPSPTIKNNKKGASAAEKAVKKIMIGSLNDEDVIPATIISTQDCKKNPTGKWPSIRVASIDTLRGSTSASSEAPSTSPTLLMKTRPDLTIVAAKKPDARKEDENGT